MRWPVRPFFEAGMKKNATVRTTRMRKKEPAVAMLTVREELPYEFTYLTVGKRDNRFERILKLDIGGFHIGINIGKDLRFRV